jgi:hypothetical protein
LGGFIHEERHVPKFTRFVTKATAKLAPKATCPEDAA